MRWLMILGIVILTVATSSCSGVYKVRAAPVYLSNWNKDKVFKKYQIVTLLDSLGKHYKVKQLRWTRDSVFGYIEPATDLMCVHQIEYYIHEESRATITQHRNHLHLRTLRVVNPENEKLAMSFKDLNHGTRHQVGPSNATMISLGVLGGLVALMILPWL